MKYLVSPSLIWKIQHLDTCGGCVINLWTILRLDAFWMSVPHPNHACGGLNASCGVRSTSVNAETTTSILNFKK